MTAHEGRRLDQVGRADRRFAEAQVRDGPRARFVGVVDEIGLREEPRVFGDDLDALPVCADGAVGAESVEDCARDVGRLEVERAVVG